MGREGLEWYSTWPKESLQKLDKLLKSSSPEIIETLLTDSSLSKFMGFFLKFHDEIRSGKHQKTAKLWISYMDHTSLILALQKAVQNNHFREYFSVLIIILKNLQRLQFAVPFEYTGGITPSYDIY